MQRKPYSNSSKCDVLICPNPKCNNVSSKLYLVENKIVTALSIWFKNYKVDYTKLENSLNLYNYENTKLIKKSILRTKKEIEKENAKLDKIYVFLENGIYSNYEFVNRSKVIKENINTLKSKLEEYNLKLQENKELENKKTTEIPKLENIMDLYYVLETAEDKNIFLKSLISKVTYLKTKKAIKKDSDFNDFELSLYPKISKSL